MKDMAKKQWCPVYEGVQNASFFKRERISFPLLYPAENK